MPDLIYTYGDDCKNKATQFKIFKLHELLVYISTRVLTLHAQDLDLNPAPQKATKQSKTLSSGEHITANVKKDVSSVVKINLPMIWCSVL